MVASAEHDSKVAGHFGQDKTLELLTRHFYWPKMEEWVGDYVRSCDTCQRNKSPRHAKYGLLHPLELAYSPWQSISMDFITQLPKSEGNTSVWVIVDRFSKMAHCIPLTEPATAENLAKVFVREIWRLHGLPSDIVSDRDSRFTSNVWQGVLTRLGVRPRMSTSFRPQTDGQTEKVNQSVELYVRTFCNYEQDDWTDLLPMAEYAYNNSITQGTGLSLFNTNYGFHPRMNWPTAEEAKDPASDAYVHYIKSVHELCGKGLEKARERMAKYYDQHRQEAPAYTVGDLVMLSGQNISTRRPSKKFANKLHGPFEVVKILSRSAVRLSFPNAGESTMCSMLRYWNHIAM
jgi:transposase InsO family protein